MAEQRTSHTPQTSMGIWIGALGGVIVTVIIISVAVIAGQSAQAQGATTPLRQITVIGTGEVEGTPDTAHVTIGVETRGDTTSAALAVNNEQVAELIARLQELGIDEEDIQTSSFNIYPEYDDTGQTIVGYNVNNSVDVTIREVEETGSLLDEVVQVGANRIYGIAFSVDEPAELYDQARERALENARTRAETMADTIGATVGDVLVVTENIGTGPPIPFGMGGVPVQEEARSDVPVEVGQQTFSARVQVTYVLQ